MKNKCIIGILLLFFLTSCEKKEDVFEDKDNNRETETLFVADGSGYIYSLNPESGKAKWDFKTGGDIIERLIVTDGIVYVNSRGDRVYSVDASTGKLKWSFNAKNQGAHYQNYSIAASKDIVFINVGYEGLYAIDATNGDIRWYFPEYSHNGEVLRPVLSDGLVFFSTHEMFYALDYKTGEIKWSVRRPDNHFDGYYYYFTMTVANGIVFLAGQDGFGNGFLSALDAYTGIQKWQVESGKEMGYLKVSNGILYVVASDDHGYLYAFDPVTGTRKWAFETVKPMIGSIAISGDKVFICSRDEYLYAIDANNGSKKWSYEASRIDLRYSSPMIVGNYCYFTGGSNVFVVDKNSGKEKWTTKVESIRSSALVYNETLCYGTEDGLKAFEATTGNKKWVFIKEDRSSAFFTPCLLLKNGEVINAGEFGVTRW